MKLIESIKQNLTLLILIVAIGGSGIYFLVIHPIMRVKNAPELLDVYVTVKIKGNDYATNDYLVVTPEDEPILHAVVVAKIGTDRDPVYFTQAEKLKINGKVIDEEKIQEWDTFKWKELRFLWFKIEPYVQKPDRDKPLEYSFIHYKLDFQHTWPYQWSHKLDVNGFSDNYPRQNFGTMRFKVRAEMKESSVEFLQKVVSKGEEDLGEDGLISDSVFRITQIPEKTFFGYVLANINTAFTRNIDYSDEKLFSKGIAAGPDSYFTGAARVYGYENSKLGDLEVLNTEAEIIFDKVTYNSENGLYLDKTGSPIKTDVLKKGDLFFQGDVVGVYGGEGSMAAGELYFLSSDDRILMSRDLPLYYEKAGNHFKDFSIGRLK